MIPYQDYTFDTDYLDIYCLGDVHWGHRENKLRDNFCNIIDKIAKDEQAHWLSHGDLLEHAVRFSVSEGVKSEPVDEEYLSMVKLLTPIKERGLAMIGGNHGLGRAIRGSSLDPDLVLSNKLGIPYFGAMGVLQVTVRKANYVIFMWHGRSAASTTAGKMLSGSKMEYVVCNADVYLFGHTHLGGQLFPASFEVDKIHKRIKILDKIQLNAGHMLDFVTYAQIFGFRPHTPQLARMRLHSSYPKRVEIFWERGE